MNVSEVTVVEVVHEFMTKFREDLEVFSEDMPANPEIILCAFLEWGFTSDAVLLNPRSIERDANGDSEVLGLIREFMALGYYKTAATILAKHM